MIAISYLTLLLTPIILVVSAKENPGRPNILFVISDDQSYPHTSAYGNYGINTPAFDQLAETGVLFQNAFVAAPQCSPNRASILTGRYIWQNEEAGTHSSLFPKDLPVFTRILEKSGYHVGYTGKPWSPGNWKQSGWDRNPVGTEYNEHHLVPPTTGISDIDYVANFEEFLDKRASGQPFFFWFGAKEPHLKYEYGSGLRSGKKLQQAKLPPFLPLSEVTQTSFLDYAREIEWFDQQLMKMIRHLESIGELHNTIIVVTSDNGMPYPYSKANLQEFGVHVPLVISGPSYFPGGRTTNELVSHVDIAPTILEWTGAGKLQETSGKSFIPLLSNSEPHRSFILTGRERHTHARPDNLGYPARAIRTNEFLYIWNVKPDLWPMGIPRPEGLTAEQYNGSFSKNFKEIGIGYADIDDSPIKQYLYKHRLKYPDLFDLSFGKRPEEQLYQIVDDPWCLVDLSNDPKYEKIRMELKAKLKAQLAEQNDPRMGANGDIFDSYPRFGGMRYYSGFNKRGEYNPAYQK